MLQIEGLIFATFDVNIVKVSSRFVNDNKEGKLVGWDSMIGCSHYLKQIKINIKSHSTCKRAFTSFKQSKLLCGTTVNPNDTTSEVINTISLII